MPDTLNCTIVTPEVVALDAQADFVAVPLFDGEIGIAKNRSPLIGRLGYGEFRLRREGEVTRYYIDGGFVQVADNRVTILTGRAIPAENVDPQAASEQISSALKSPVSSPEQLEIRDRLIAQARGQLRVARRGK